MSLRPGAGSPRRPAGVRDTALFRGAHGCVTWAVLCPEAPGRLQTRDTVRRAPFDPTSLLSMVTLCPPPAPAPGQAAELRPDGPGRPERRTLAPAFLQRPRGPSAVLDRRPGACWDRLHVVCVPEPGRASFFPTDVTQHGLNPK
ncbi:unnamed protein product [Rangifer tarandus platyrhynchus]|uniref:Uncharacterized protein n=1 Tax=Rangifer tarandus platyrhynchus TaxID=3082113 RepID=A0AC59ZWA0_RANTA